MSTLSDSSVEAAPEQSEDPLPVAFFRHSIVGCTAFERETMFNARVYLDLRARAATGYGFTQPIDDLEGCPMVHLGAGKI